MSKDDDFPGASGAREAGLFTWDIAKNLVYADGAVADLFGLDRLQAEHGLPLQRFIDRVHADDVENVTSAIRQSVATGQPYQENCRVYGLDEEINQVMSFGRSFTDAGGQPCAYAGIIFPLPAEPEPENKLLWHCLVAYDLARNEKRYDVAEQLLAVLSNIDWQGAESKTKFCI